MTKEINKNETDISEYIEDLSDSELVALWNEYCQDMGYGDDEIYENDEEFFEIHFSNKVMDAVRAVSYGEYRFSGKYVRFNGYANLETFSSPDKEIDKTTLVQAILSEEFAPYGIELVEPEEEESEE